MSIQTEVDRINTSVNAAYAVLEGLGAAMPGERNVDNLAATAATIPRGGTTVAHNLLHNSNWTYPINQRGETAYRGLKYSIDRWVVPSDTAALTVGDGFVLIQNDSTTGTAMFTQRMTAGTLVAGRIYTAVITMNDGTVISGSATCVDGSDGVNITDTSSNLYAQIARGSSYDSFRLAVAASSYSRIKNVALYAGEYAAETPPVYLAQGFASELAACQRYFQRIGTNGTYGLPLAYGHMATTTTARLVIPLAADMRTAPTMTATGVKFTIRSHGKGVNLTSNPTVWLLRRNMLFLTATSPEAMTSSGPAELQYYGDSSTQRYIEFSADL